jgi:hypothetical protein
LAGYPGDRAHTSAGDGVKAKKWCTKTTQHSFRRRKVFCDVVRQFFSDVFDGAANLAARKEVLWQVRFQDHHRFQKGTRPRLIGGPVDCPITSSLPRSHLKSFYEWPERRTARRPFWTAF